MAREQRKDVDYFPHDCTHGRKMHIIETKYGNDGYATWFKLLEQLGKANNHYIDASDEMTLMFLTSVFKIDEEKTLSILNDLAKLGAIDKLLFDDYKVIYSQKFCDSIQDAYRKRKTEMFQYSAVLDEIRRKRGQSAGDCPQKEVNPREIAGSYPQRKEEYSIVEESKEEEIKEEEILLEKETKKNTPFPFKKKLVEYGFNESLVDDWLKVRKTKKATNTETAFKSFIAEIESQNCNIDEMLQTAVTNSWSGFKHKWVDNLKNQNQNGTTTKSNSEIFTAAVTSEVGQNFRFK